MAGQTPPKRIHLVSLGCPKNLVDSENLLASVIERGAELTADPRRADGVIVNTCGFLEAAASESIETILELAKLKAKKPGQRLVIAGCLPGRYGAELAPLLPEVDAIIGGPGDPWLDQWLGARQAHRARDPGALAGAAQQSRVLTTEPWWAYLKISEGCSNTCAFCTIPAIRGPQASRTAADIVSEARRLVASGVVEINLVAQDLTAYGFDLTPRRELADVVEPLCEIPGLRWLRLMYAYPRRLSARLLKLLAAGRPLLPYLDMPLQHIDSGVLKAMARGTTEAHIRRQLDAIREAVPGAALRTSFIAGHPGETPQAFDKLLRFVEEQRFRHVGVFPFSREEGTPSHDLPGQVGADEAVRRAGLVMEVQQGVSRAFNRKLVGCEVEALLGGPSEASSHLLEARMADQAPGIDGVVFVNEGYAPAGSLVRLKVSQAADYDVVGAVTGMVHGREVPENAVRGQPGKPRRGRAALVVI